MPRMSTTSTAPKPIKLTANTHFLVRCKERKSLFVMPMGDYPARKDFYDIEGRGRFIGKYQSVPGRIHKGRPFTSDRGDFYIFAAGSALEANSQG